MAIFDRLKILFAPRKPDDSYDRYIQNWSQKAFTPVSVFDSQWKLGLPKEKNEENYALAYQSVDWVYVAVKAVVETASMLPLCIYETAKTKTGSMEKKEVTSGAIYDLLRRPNPFTNELEMKQALIGSYCLTGNAFLYFDVDDFQLWVLHSKEVKILASKPSFIDSYVFQARGSADIIKIEPHRMVHIKSYHPRNYFYGLSPLEAAWRSVNYQDKEADFWEIFWKEGGRLQGAFTVDGPLSKDEFDRMQLQLRKNYGGRNQHRNLILDNGLKFQQMGLSQKDAQIIDKFRLTREDILAAFSVPPSIAGVLELANYSNMEIQEKLFYIRGILPILRLIEAGFNSNPLLSLDGKYSFEFDTSDIEVLQRNLERIAKIGGILIESGQWTQNEVRENLWAMEPSTDSAADALKPINTTITPFFSQGTNINKSMPMEEMKELPMPKPPLKSRYSPEMKRIAAKAFDDSLQENDAEMADMIKRFFAEQKGLVLGNVHKVLKERGSVTLSGNEEISNLLVGLESLIPKFADNLAKQYQPIISKFGHQAVQELDKQTQQGKHVGSYSMKADFRVKDPRIARFIKERSTAVAGVVSQTQLDGLREGIASKFSEGAGIPEIADFVESYFDVASSSRAATIARTETAAAANEAISATWDQNSDIVKGKEWVTANDDAVRDSHQIDGQAVALDDLFELKDGEKAGYPMDPGLSAGNTINCRCTTVPVLDFES